MKAIQMNEPVDVAYWLRDEEFAEYPEGARDKTLLYCPTSSVNQFLRTGHRYLFKRSSPRYEEQFWVEIIAYRLGSQMGIPVPPAFVAYDSKKGQSGALIEWFLNQVDSFSYEAYIPGGDYCQQYIPNFDRKKGEQHNFETVAQIFTDLSKKHPSFNTDWKSYWAKALTFDALIGNTDRHQDNWGIIVNPTNDEMRISPVFDNGTSMGHEIFSNKFALYDDKSRLEKYVSKGWHHMKWKLNDTSPMEHLELLKKFAGKYPETHTVMLDCLKNINYEILKDILDNLTACNVPVRLTAERAAFMLKLLQFRHQRLLSELEK
jgi:HipA-like C-terminal domain